MKIVIYTLGCKVNQYESNSLLQSLKEAGHTVVTKLEPADLYILNTCAVTAQSEQKSRQLVAKVNKLNENAKIIIMGCASQNNPAQFENKPNVSLVMGVAGKQLIPNLLDKIGNLTKELPKEYEDNFKTAPSRTRATLKIQDGCNNYCSFCLIPYLRGDSRSRPLDSIVEEAQVLSQVTNEIVITGINTSDYKIDGELALGKLMSELKDTQARIRISSLEVNVITKQFLTTLKQLPNFAPHFHLSLQSGCDKTLREMNRKYTAKEYLQKVKLIRKHFKNASITTDLIVGFPTETEEDFKKTLKTLKAVKFFDIHTFPYSKRAGTAAQNIKEISPEIIKARLEQVKQVRDEGFSNYIAKNLHQIKTVLLEVTHDGFMIGHTEDFIKVYTPRDEQFEKGKCIKIKLIAPYKDGAVGQII